jgi:hypothetical protein
MPDGCCLLFTVPDDTSGADQISGHLDLARELLGDASPTVELNAVDGSASVALAVTHDADALTKLRDRSPLTAARHVLCGVDPDAIADGAADSSDGYIDLILDHAEPPIPFDDPTVLGILRDYQRSYLALLGRRYLRCDALWRDGVRAAGAFVAFTAADEDEARWMAAANPWRRVAPGRLLRLPQRVVRTSLPPPGPGTQRSAHFPCAPSRSVSEPGVGRQKASGT